MAINTHRMTPTKEDRAEAQRVIDAGYYQVSRSHRQVNRLPAGMTGKEALRSVTPPARHYWVDAMTNSSAGQHYLSMYCSPEDQLTLSQPVFHAFRELGGGTYHSKTWVEDEERLIKVFFCEVPRTFLRPNRSYRIELHPDCEACRAGIEASKAIP